MIYLLYSCIQILGRCRLLSPGCFLIPADIRCWHGGDISTLRSASKDSEKLVRTDTACFETCSRKPYVPFPHVMSFQCQSEEQSHL
jgi:hypothetical protein